MSSNSCGIKSYTLGTMARPSFAVALLGVAMLVVMTTHAASASQNSRDHISREEAREMLRSMVKSRAEGKQGMDSILPFLFLLNGGNFLQYSVAVIMAAAAFGTMAVNGILTAPLYKWTASGNACWTLDTKLTMGSDSG